ncbi:DUF309 domain-containing protein [Saccharibacillus alkalitolerans]|uniref:DUF309 domain-containing protein n=1 Tax=Saccharibacillus alkalitolerans TaxID=2705290 RepID=A0ABX0F7Y4_9BACL|nr:DUF309 domain-containing protein [Saccharibacillus alkalitolerans]NGZ75693.1 DUF309 domain-containing protein [Saccharibacillus alkalitolerans]
MKVEPNLAAFLVYFNRDRDYFECHEVLEELWLERGRDPLYSGLLQVAVALYHFRNGSVKRAYNKIEGARKMMRSAVRKLSDYPADSLGIRMDKLTADAREYLGRLERYEREPFAFYPLEIEIADPEVREQVRAADEAIAPNVPQRTGYSRGPKAKPGRGTDGEE